MKVWYLEVWYIARRYDLWRYDTRRHWRKTIQWISLQHIWRESRLLVRGRSSLEIVSLTIFGEAQGKHCTLYTVHCTLYTALCTLYTVHCTLHTIHCTLHCTLQNVIFKLHTVYTAHNEHYILHIRNYTILHTSQQGPATLYISSDAGPGRG